MFYNGIEKVINYGVYDRNRSKNSTGIYWITWNICGFSNYFCKFNYWHVFKAKI